MQAQSRHAKYSLGQVVRHRSRPFRGVIFDVDPEFANSDEWYEAIPESMRPAKDQPFYHLLAENAESSYIAYVSQQNLVPDDSDEPVDHPGIAAMFDRLDDGRYRLIYEAPLPLPPDDSPDAVRDLTQRCTKVLEKYVRVHPERWLWMHRRWRDDVRTTESPSLVVDDPAGESDA